ncbi:ArsC family reductase [Ferrovibrio terrae]|uniref:ArsC family reductase n=1 Tax=Ferrovibrio terrae TaxID=2594003 RepID=A0A516H6F6_9PROT|nr:ArsC family reductase [Ferrovibrio terrae]QDO99347.1 ArsC family reductase [Ferrovibrio terrae]
MPVTIYGIKNCDTMKKAFTWLKDRGVKHDFHDYKASGIDQAHLESWCGALGWEAVLNRAGTTFRKLPDSDRENLTEKKAIALMIAQPSMIKRPMLEYGPEGNNRKVMAGFRPDAYAAALKR